MEGQGLKQDRQRWSWRLLCSWDDTKKDWEFFLRGGDAAEGRRWGISLGGGFAISLAMMASGGFGAWMQHVFGTVVDARILVALAGVMLALGSLAGKGKPWAALALMLAFPAFVLLFVIAASIETWPVLREVGGPAWVCKLLPLVALAALWARGGYLAWRSLRRGTHEPAVAIHEA